MTISSFIWEDQKIKGHSCFSFHATPCKNIEKPIFLLRPSTQFNVRLTIITGDFERAHSHRKTAIAQQKSALFIFKKGANSLAPLSLRKHRIKIC